MVINLSITAHLSDCVHMFYERQIEVFKTDGAETYGERPTISHYERQNELDVL